MEALINIVLLTLLAAVTVGIVVQRNLFAVVVLAGIYSFLMATVLIVLDAVDVAMTEASVGAGISTVLLLGTLHLVQDRSNTRRSARRWCRCWSPVRHGRRAGLRHARPAALRRRRQRRSTRTSCRATSPTASRRRGVPNVVTSVLADYRGYDTLGETTVIFTAGIGVHAAAQGRRRRTRPRRAQEGGKTA